ncbi:LCP family protein [Ruania rhizosphaerae]|uniref:LCP family protein n=1 Tax=Ruania rhizosphaerae TaxID=1840413 RepID=UPI001F3B9199|nr:LCP family protein [Ruania rhizosphaerae]
MTDDPFADEPRRAPGRRPRSGGKSRAREGGSARPISGDQGTSSEPRQAPPRKPASPAGAPAQRQVRRTSARPPSFSPGGKPADGAAQPPVDRTRAMPVSEAPPARPVRHAPAVTPERHAPPPSGPGGPGGSGGSGGPTGPSRRRRVRRRRILTVVALLLVLALAWPIGLLVWANSQINHVAATNDDLSTDGTTYLLAGSDSREDSGLTGDTTGGERTDTIILLTAPPSGTASLISIPRDTFVDIPGYGPNKINAAYAYGGPGLLVDSVQTLTGIEVDHYVEIGMGGVADVVDAVGGVELCLDYDVDDPDSDLVWEAGCHMADGDTALAFARMRKADPLGDIGRTQRQQQVISAVSDAVVDPSLVFRPGEQVRLIGAGLGALQVSEGTGIIDLGQMALAFRNATGPDGVRGTPPVANLDYRPGGVGSTVLLDPDLAPAFFEAVADGTVTEGDLQEY